MKRREHEQVWTKVNCQVDRHIVLLVNALNRIPELMTLDSCQGDCPETVPYVYFRGVTTEKTLEFCRQLGDYLGKEPDLSYGITVRWLCGSTEVMAELQTIKPDEVANAIAAFAEEVYGVKGPEFFDEAGNLLNVATSVG